MELILKEQFMEKYGRKERIWSGGSFIEFVYRLRPLLAELPISAVAIPQENYGHTYQGNLDNVFGEVISTVISYEGYLKDKAFPITGCYLRILDGTQSLILEFVINYKKNGGEETARTHEVVRNGERNFIFFSDRYRPS